MFKRISTSYLLGFLILILIGLAIYIIRNFTLSGAEVGFISAVIGGLISGGLTLIGVKATLDNQKNEKFIELYPKRKMVLDEQLDIMKELKELYEKRYSEMQYADYNEDYKKLRCNIIDCVESSIIVDARVYDVTKEFLFYSEKINGCMGPALGEFDEFTQELVTPSITCIHAGKEDEYKEQLKKLVECYLEVESIMNNFDNKYKKLTGF